MALPQRVVVAERTLHDAEAKLVYVYAHGTPEQKRAASVAFNEAMRELNEAVKEAFEQSDNCHCVSGDQQPETD